MKKSNSSRFTLKGKTLIVAQLALAVISIASVIISFNYFLSNQELYPGENSNLLEYFIKYAASIYTIFVLPGLLTILSLNLRKLIPTKLQIFTIPAISMTYWI